MTHKETNCLKCGARLQAWEINWGYHLCDTCDADMSQDALLMQIEEEQEYYEDGL